MTPNDTSSKRSSSHSGSRRFTWRPSSPPSQFHTPGPLPSLPSHLQAPVAYLTTLLLMHAFLPYTFTYAIDLPVLMTLAALGSAIGLLAVVWAETLLREDRHFVGLDASRWVRLLLIVGWAHALGVAHHFARRIDVLEASALRLRQQVPRPRESDPVSLAFPTDRTPLRSFTADRIPPFSLILSASCARSPRRRSALRSCSPTSCRLTSSGSSRKGS